jgi:hypothetical protein
MSEAQEQHFFLFFLLLEKHLLYDVSTAGILRCETDYEHGG